MIFGKIRHFCQFCFGSYKFGFCNFDFYVFVFACRQTAHRIQPLHRTHQHLIAAVYSIQAASVFHESSSAMIDPFAEALCSDSDDGADGTNPAEAHSPGTNPAEAHSPVAGTAPVAATTPRKRALAAAKATVATKRKRSAPNPLEVLIMTPLNEVGGTKIESIFVPARKGEQTHAIPLWPQFTAVWRGADFGNRTWLKVAPTSRWVEHLVTVVTKHKSRNVIQRMCLAVRAEFAACLTRARVAQCATLGKSASQVFAEQILEDSDASNDEDTLDDSDDSQHTPPPKEAAMAVDIAGKCVMCINTMKQFCLAVDGNTLEFIKDVLVPLIHKTAHSPAKTKHRATPTNKTTPNGSQPMFQFSFDLNHVCNNIPQKVQWNPKTHSWRVLAQKVQPGTAITKSFQVDKGLSSAEYHKHRVAMYLVALEAWNTSDGSRRHRIRLPQLVNAVGDAVCIEANAYQEPPADA